MIDVSELMTDPDFAHDYTVYRKSGHWLGGDFIETEEPLLYYGPVIAANSKDLEQLPEGDRVKGLMVFYSDADHPLYITRNLDNQKGTSDQIVWHDERYKLIQVYPYQDYGYYKAIGARMAGD